ncbi:MAG: hypothetical protein EOP45_22575 [Sphingobacteriaceae bacterium]|nr:MAG: hypothetical protein EOP45_22575 [Sphingobacteriaceae bacterium]
MEFVHFIMGNKGQVDVLYTDFKKAFDKVNHQILIKKMNELGLPQNLIYWIKSYLTDRPAPYRGRNFWGGSAPKYLAQEKERKLIF